MLLVNQGFTTIPTCLLLTGKGTSDADSQPSKIPLVDKQQWACQGGPSLQRRREVLGAMITLMAAVMRVCQSA
jgi:hypothetical protein